MNSSIKPIWSETLPEPLPAEPLELAARWLQQARVEAAQPNPNAMVLATVDGDGQPSARVVLCKEIDPHTGCILFFTNYESRKGRELRANPKAAVVFHWDQRHRQVRAEGRVEPLAPADSDAYFRSRPWQSRLGAWASRQSEPCASREALAAALNATARRFGIAYEGPGIAQGQEVTVDIPCPPNWGGYRLRVEAMELWVEGEFRIHDRARWTRPASVPGAADNRQSWAVARLQP